jgi:DNA-binding IclR family transcriptional regulator
MAGVLERTLAILEKLADHVDGLPLATIADDLDIPRSAAHRLLLDLSQQGYVRQSRGRGDYVLTTKLVSLGLNFLKHSGVPDISQPILDRLAANSGELVRLGVVDVDHVTWVAKAQGARSGLLYDPDMGIDARLSCSASGHAWLASLSDDEALELVSKQGFGKPEEYGPNAITTPTALLKALKQARKQGYAIAIETYTAGLSAMGAAVVPKGKGAVGVITISGPSVRLTEQKMQSLVPDLMQAASDMAAASAASSLFDRPYAAS